MLGCSNRILYHEKLNLSMFSWTVSKSLSFPSVQQENKIARDQGAKWAVSAKQKLTARSLMFSLHCLSVFL